MSAKEIKSEARFAAAVERFVRQTVGLTGDFCISRCRISGGADSSPVIDLRIVPCSPDTAFKAFSDTGAASVDRLIYLTAVWLEANGGSFAGTTAQLYSKMVSKRSVLSAAERRAVPAPQWIGRIFSQAAAVGSKRLAFRHVRSGDANRWEVSLKRKAVRDGNG
jgi:hypothetical protein